MPRPTCRLTLADVVDLAQLFHGDRQANVSQAEQRERDRDIALASPEARDDAARLSAWLRIMRQRQGLDGQRPARYVLQGVSALLLAMGFALGALTVGGWLSLNKLVSSPAAPPSGINVIYFWSVTAGWQALMLGVMLAGFAFGGRARPPGFIPKLAETLIARFWPSQRQALHVLQSWLTHAQRYRRLAFWYPLRLSQRFAVGLNLGLTGAFLFFSIATQPIFVWQSGQLNCARLERATGLIASPWSWLDARGRPSADDIRRTYRPPDAQHAHSDCAATAGAVGAGWWPFLFASMLVYGLIPRLLLDALSSWRVRRAVHDVALQHPDSQELLRRMQRPVVDTGARLQPAGASPAPEPLAPEPEAPTVPGGRGFICKWAGIRLTDDEICILAQRQWGIDAMALYEVGGLDVSRDEEALAALAAQRHIDHVLLLVEAWQPPVSDYRHFVAQLRQTLRDGKMIWVLLYHRSANGDLAAPRPSDLEQWRSTLERIDAWLRVQPMLEEPAG